MDPLWKRIWKAFCYPALFGICYVVVGFFGQVVGKLEADRWYAEHPGTVMVEAVGACAEIRTMVLPVRSGETFTVVAPMPGEGDIVKIFRIRNHVGSFFGEVHLCGPTDSNR
jgi:hypothetical protein